MLVAMALSVTAMASTDRVNAAATTPATRGTTFRDRIKKLFNISGTRRSKGHHGIKKPDYCNEKDISSRLGSGKQQNSRGRRETCCIQHAVQHGEASVLDDCDLTLQRRGTPVGESDDTSVTHRDTPAGDSDTTSPVDEYNPQILSAIKKATSPSTQQYSSLHHGIDETNLFSPSSNNQQSVPEKDYTKDLSLFQQQNQQQEERNNSGWSGYDNVANIRQSAEYSGAAVAYHRGKESPSPTSALPTCRKSQTSKTVHFQNGNDKCVHFPSVEKSQPRDSCANRSPKQQNFRVPQNPGVKGFKVNPASASPQHGYRPQMLPQNGSRLPVSPQNGSRLQMSPRSVVGSKPTPGNTSSSVVVRHVSRSPETSQGRVCDQRRVSRPVSGMSNISGISAANSGISSTSKKSEAGSCHSAAMSKSLCSSRPPVTGAMTQSALPVKRRTPPPIPPRTSSRKPAVSGTAAIGQSAARSPQTRPVGNFSACPNAAPKAPGNTCKSSIQTQDENSSASKAGRATRYVPGGPSACPNAASKAPGNKSCTQTQGENSSASKAGKAVRYVPGGPSPRQSSKVSDMQQKGGSPHKGEHKVPAPAAPCKQSHKAEPIQYTPISNGAEVVQSNKARSDRNIESGFIQPKLPTSPNVTRIPRSKVSPGDEATCIKPNTSQVARKIQYFSSLATAPDAGSSADAAGRSCSVHFQASPTPCRGGVSSSQAAWGVIRDHIRADTLAKSMDNADQTLEVKSSCLGGFHTDKASVASGCSCPGSVPKSCQSVQTAFGITGLHSGEAAACSTEASPPQVVRPKVHHPQDQRNIPPDPHQACASPERCHSRKDLNGAGQSANAEPFNSGSNFQESPRVVNIPKSSPSSRMSSRSSALRYPDTNPVIRYPGSKTSSRGLPTAPLWSSADSSSLSQSQTSSASPGNKSYSKTHRTPRIMMRQSAVDDSSTDSDNTSASSSRKTGRPTRRNRRSVSSSPNQTRGKGSASPRTSTKPQTTPRKVCVDHAKFTRIGDTLI